MSSIHHYAKIDEISEHTHSCVKCFSHDSKSNQYFLQSPERILYILYTIVFKIQGDSFISLESTICCMLHGGNDDAKFKYSMANPLRANPILSCIMRKQSGGVNRQSVIARTTSNKLKSLSASIKNAQRS